MKFINVLLTLFFTAFAVYSENVAIKEDKRNVEPVKFSAGNIVTVGQLRQFIAQSKKVPLSSVAIVSGGRALRTQDDRNAISLYFAQGITFKINDIHFELKNLK